VTATAQTRRRKRPPDGRSVQRAELLLRRARLQLHPDVPHDQAVAMLAQVLDRHDPFASEHGRLLVAAFRGRTRKERRAGPRPAAEQAVRDLLACGQAPTPAAVAAAVDQYQRHERGLVRKVARLAPTADRDGPSAAQAVVDHWREHGRRPSPAQLGRQLGWPSHDVWAVIHLLVEAGWLALHHGDLRPGPRARQPAAVR
jgi:hypothetical protein